MRKYYIVSLLLIVLFAIAPFVSRLLGSAVANAAGCTLNEAEAHRCIIHGHDYGDTLYAMGMAFWLMIFTLPLAELGFVIWAIVLAVHLFVRRRRRRRSEQRV